MNASSPMYYASFLQRLNAYGIDTLLVMILAWIISAILGDMAFAQTPDDMQQLNQLIDALQQASAGEPVTLTPALEGVSKTQLLGFLLSPGSSAVTTLLVSGIYNIAFVVSDWQATPGKRFYRLKIVNSDGSRPTFSTAAMRHLSSGLSTGLLGLGYAWMWRNPKRQALHDILSHTCVVVTPRAPKGLLFTPEP